MGSGGNAAGSGATQAGAVACTYGPQFIEASRPERRAARGPAPEAARQHCPFSIRKSLQRATNRRGERYRPSAGKPCPSAWKALWALSRRRHVYAAKCPSTRHYLRATSDNRRSARWPRRCRARRLPHRSAHYVAATAGDQGQPAGVPGCGPSMTGTARPARSVAAADVWLRRTGGDPRGLRPDPILWSELWAATCGCCRLGWRRWNQLKNTGRQGR